MLAGVRLPARFEGMNGIENNLVFLYKKPGCVHIFKLAWVHLEWGKPKHGDSEDRGFP